MLQSPLLFLLVTAVDMLARGKSRPVEPGRVIEVVAVGHAVEVGGPQALGGRGGLVAGVVLGGLFVGTGVVGGAVEAEGYI